MLIVVSMGRVTGFYLDQISLFFVVVVVCQFTTIANNSRHTGNVFRVKIGRNYCYYVPLGSQ